MNSSLRFAILNHLNDVGRITLNGFFPKKYSRTAPIRALLGLNNIGYASVDDAKRSLSVTLSRLKREGFIISSGARKKTMWMISKKGRDHIKEHSTLEGADSVHIVSDGVQRLVIFDIPEKDRKQRVWLRRELLACGYSPLQKSAYLGTCPLPADLLAEIYEKNMHKNVHIMSLDKLGTVERYA